MRRAITAVTAVVLLLGVAGVAAAQPDPVGLDFEDDLPGFPQDFPGGYDFYGGGVTDPIVTKGITEDQGAGGTQGYQVTVDASNNEGGWGWYYGLGGFLGFFGEGYGFAEGEAGEDIPGYYQVSFDLKLTGNEQTNPDWDHAVGGGVTLYKSDYETVYQVDLNDDGDMEDGYDIWSSTFTANVTGSGYTHVVWNLASGTDPTAPAAEIVDPIFDDDSTFSFQLYWNSGGFGIDDGNVVDIDNIFLEYVEPGPGDKDFDGDVDVADLMEWQRSDGSAAGLADWQSNFTGAPPASAAIGAVPEPSAAVCVLMGAAAFASRRRRRGA